MAFEIERNRRLYREADDGIPALPGASRRCVATARVLYARILERIEAADYDVFGTRARVPTPLKAALAVRMVAVTRADAARARGPRRPRPARTAPGCPTTRSCSSTTEEPRWVRHRSRRSTMTTPRCTWRSPATSSTRDGRLLVTTRATSKPSFPGVVTNTVCGHPLPGEDLAEAVRRRASSELGVDVRDLRLVLPDFGYRAVMNGVVEHERCPVFVGWVDDASIGPDPEEVDGGGVGSLDRLQRRRARGRPHRLAVVCRAGADARCPGAGPDVMAGRATSRAPTGGRARARRRGGLRTTVDDRYQYLLLMAGCLVITLPLEFVLRARVYRRPRRLLLSLLPMLVRLPGVGRLRDRRGHWRYSPEYTTGIRPARVPLEEYVFFVVIPLCGLLTYEAVGTVLGWVHRWRGRDA